MSRKGHSRQPSYHPERDGPSSQYQGSSPYQEPPGMQGAGAPSAPRYAYPQTYGESTGTYPSQSQALSSNQAYATVEASSVQYGSGYAQPPRQRRQSTDQQPAVTYAQPTVYPSQSQGQTSNRAYEHTGVEGTSAQGNTQPPRQRRQSTAQQPALSYAQPTVYPSQPQAQGSTSNRGYEYNSVEGTGSQGNTQLPRQRRQSTAQQPAAAYVPTTGYPSQSHAQGSASNRAYDYTGVEGTSAQVNTQPPRQRRESTAQQPSATYVQPTGYLSPSQAQGSSSNHAYAGGGGDGGQNRQAYTQPPRQRRQSTAQQTVNAAVYAQAQPPASISASRSHANAASGTSGSYPVAQTQYQSANSQSDERPSKETQTVENHFAKYKDTIDDFVSRKQKLVQGDRTVYSKFDNFMVVASNIVNIFAVAGDWMPPMKVAANAAQALMKLYEKVTGNDKIACGVMFEMVDLLCDLMKVENFTKLSHRQSDFNLKKFMDDIANDINRCHNDVSDFMQRPLYAKVFLVGRYEDCFNGHATQFQQYRNQFRTALSIHTAGVVTENHDLLKKIHDILRTQEQQTLDRSIKDAGGVGSLLKDKKKTKKAFSDIRVFDSDTIITAIGTIRQANEALDDSLRRVEAKLDAIERGVDKLARHADNDSVKSTGYEHLDKMLARCFRKGVLLATSELGREFETFYYGGGKVLEDATESWMIAFVGQDYAAQIMDAYDRNASGNITEQEVITFARARPKSWTILRWTVFWTIAWPTGIERARGDIRRYVKAIKNSGYTLDTDFTNLVDMLVQCTENVNGVSSTHLEFVKVQLKEGEQYLKARIPGRLSSSDEVTSACSGRIELWIFTLLSYLLRKWRDKLEDGDHQGLAASQRAIVDAFRARAEEVKSGERAALFAYGMFQSTNMPSGASIGSTPRAPEYPPGAPESVSPKNSRFPSVSVANSPSGRPIGGRNAPLPSTNQSPPSIDRPAPQTRDFHLPSSDAPEKAARGVNTSGKDSSHLPLSSSAHPPVEVLEFQRDYPDRSNTYLQYNSGNIDQPHGRFHMQSSFDVIQPRAAKMMPVWNPEPDLQSRPLTVGDVASFDDIRGIFIPHFNIFLSAEKNLKQLGLRTPPGFQPFPRIKTQRHSSSGAGVHHSNFTRCRMDSSKHFAFRSENLKKITRGSIMILPKGHIIDQLSLRESAEELQQYLDQHLLSWYQYLKHSGRLINGRPHFNGSLFFASATMTTTTWIMATLYSDKSVAISDLEFSPQRSYPFLHGWDHYTDKDNNRQKKSLIIRQGPDYAGDPKRKVEFDQLLGATIHALWIPDHIWNSEKLPLPSANESRKTMWGTEKGLSFAQSIITSITGLLPW